MKDDRCPTGITGFDKLVEGGFPRSRSILVSGMCGTGKTAFAMEFLYRGITEYNEPGVLVVLEENPIHLKKDLMAIGIDLEKVEKEDKLLIIDASLSRRGEDAIMLARSKAKGLGQPILPKDHGIEDITNAILDAAKKIGAKRVVIDSITALDSLIKSEANVRDTILDITFKLQDASITSVLISEIMSGDESMVSRHGIEEYTADGVIILKANEALDTRTIRVIKMRQTNHSLKPTTFRITAQGLEVK